MLMGSDYFSERNIHHQCQTCVLLHKDGDIRNKLSSEWKKYLIPTIQKFNLKRNGVSI